jgi:hypothetical protein
MVVPIVRMMLVDLILIVVLPGVRKAFNTHCDFMFQGPLKKKKKQISRFGYIDKLITDNSPQFASGEFAKFAK